MRQIFLLLIFSLCCSGQQTVPTPASDEANLTALTTPMEVTFKDGGSARGSGFFYFEYAKDDGKQQGPHWVAVEHMYVVTARHVIQPKRLEQLSEFRYALRESSGDHVNWHVMKLTAKELGQRLHLCRNERADVAVVEVGDTISAETVRLVAEKAQLLNFSGVSSTKFPGKSVLQAQPGDDVLVIGYPKGIFDRFNKLPVLKTGVLNTPIGTHFNGLDAFLLDFKYYAGSSGSLIISKPTRLAYDKDGRLEGSTTPQYLFLGVYQGEQVWNDITSESADLGLGWYYYNVEEAIEIPPVVRASPGSGLK